MAIVFGILAIITLLGVIGQVLCIIKAVKCAWNPIGKAEIIYTIGSITGLGCVIGWLKLKND